MEAPQGWLTMVSITSDAALMAALGFRDAEAGGVLGKTRQAVNSGLRGGRSDYFAAGDIINLMIDARTSGRVFDEAAIEA